MLKSNLKVLLDERNIPIRQVSRDIDYRLESIRMLYHDEMERYPRDLLDKLCVYLDVPIEKLLIFNHE
ncbi:helix-turn-helix domain-containing protein [Priestia flexa]|uniref:helix-turn-helix domain-containing protein n=1 Tax=Priestia flexa TaxID=86664 RepID=UPI00240DF0C5|nr:helix-turn-helix transcriptional regulator [Priestia flexa]WEZ09589.1 helix-turn-helix transcriptional regulator [Priestia flexa]